MKALLNQKYLKRDTIDKDVTNLLDDADLSSIIGILSCRNQDCQIVLKNRVIELFGPTNSVLEAKSILHEQITKVNSARISRIQQNLRISKDIQWQYKVGEVWKSFPVYLNSLIEADYGFSKPMVEFQNEENENAIVFLNVNPMVYAYGSNSFDLRRIDVTKCKIYT